MVPKQDAIIVKFDFSNDQTVGEITKIVGLVMAKYRGACHRPFGSRGQPRASRTGPVTAAIQDSSKRSATFPLKPKGCCWRTSQYERLERNRVNDHTEQPFH